jgi:hypothetical protein
MEGLRSTLVGTPVSPPSVLPSDPVSLLRPEKSVAGIAEAGQDVPLLVEALV